MALTKAITWNTYETPNAYAAIMDFQALKKVDEQGEKSFDVQVHTNVYKDSTKEVCLYGVNQTINLPYNDGTVHTTDLYTVLKTTDEWSDWTDA